MFITLNGLKSLTAFNFANSLICVIYFTWEQYKVLLQLVLDHKFVVNYLELHVGKKLKKV